LLDSDRIVLAVVRSIVIDATDIFFLVGKFPEPGASHHLLSGDRAYPDFPTADIIENLWPVRFPPVYLSV
jgi:hypothetical protein